jgi:hypothetical protein
MSSIRLPDGTRFDLPKDFRGDVLGFKREYTDTNGHLSTITLYITNFQFKMNPAVIDTKTAHDVAIFNAGADAAGKVIGAAAK